MTDDNQVKRFYPAGFEKGTGCTAYLIEQVHEVFSVINWSTGLTKRFLQYVRK